MVKKWQLSWFGESGTPLFSMVPTTITDRNLPLKVVLKPCDLS
jgi:hypothetical protein